MIRVSPNRAEPVLHALRRSIARVALLACVALTSHAFAHEGHDHGAEPAVRQQALAPRLTHESAKLEVVALLQDRDLLVYADHYASNAPVTGLRVDVRSAGRLVQALEIEPGLYRADLQLEPQSKAVQFEVNLSGEGVAEHFGGELPIDAVDAAVAKTTPSTVPNVALIAGGAIAALLLVIAGAWLLRKRRAG